MSDEHSHSAVMCKSKHASYNIHVKSNARYRKKIGQHEIHIACVVQIPNMMIQTTLKVAQGF
jgi:hypothetical protein